MLKGPSQRKLKKVLDYNQETGIFTWKGMTGKKSPTGKVAGYISKEGYVRIQVFGTIYGGHRLAWLWMEGYTPLDMEIDHIDRDASNNRWCNLRLTSRQCNMRNIGNISSNKSGVKGVCWCSVSNRWRANIKINNTQKYIGQYKDFDEAVCARLATEQCIGWDGCDSSSPAYKHVKNWM